MSNRRRIHSVIVLSVLVALFAATAAFAHATRIDRHYGWADVDGVHSHGHVCDTKADGYYVKIQYTFGGEVRQLTDQDGSGGLCPYGHADLTGGAGQYRLCKVTVDCSEWRQY